MDHGHHLVQLGPRFPPELSDAVIDFLHDDKKTLRECALVCKAWVATSRLHLFQEITLQVKHGRFPEAFVKILRSAPALSSSIKVLHVRSAATHSRETLHPLSALSVLDHLLALHSLILHVPTIDASETSDVCWSHSPLKLLQLHLSCSTLQLAKTLEFFSRVPVDEFCALEWLRTEYHRVLPVADVHIDPGSWQIKNVRLLSGSMDYLTSLLPTYFHALRPAVSRDKLVSFTAAFDASDPEPLRDLREFITTTGEQLVYLRLDASRVYSGFIQDWSFLSVCLSLETLHLNLDCLDAVQYYDDRAGDDHPIQRALGSYPAAILEHINPTLRTLHLSFSTETPWATSFTTWAAHVRWTDLELALLRFPELTGVHIREEPYPQGSASVRMSLECQDTISSHLPRLREKLQFDRVD